MNMPTDPTPVGAKGEIRCFCSRSPLLGIFGVGKNGRPFIHVKVWKQNRLYTELVIAGRDAETSIKCRECYRWYRVFITFNNSAGIAEVPRTEVENVYPSSIDDKR